MFVAALAMAATSSLLADLDGVWSFAISNRSSVAISIHTASSCTAGSVTDDDFSLEPRASISLDCGATAAEDPHAIQIFNKTGLLCTVHMPDNSMSFESDDDRCVATTAGGADPTVSIRVIDPSS